MPISILRAMNVKKAFSALIVTLAPIAAHMVFVSMGSITTAHVFVL